MTNAAKMKKVHDQVVALSGNELTDFREKAESLPVIGEGSHNPTFVFIGEAPGRNEAKTGRPFCGAAGKILDNLLKSIELQRKDIYITNIVKDRPPNNRDPLPNEIAAYGPFLDEQLDILKPKVIVTLGRYAMEYIMRKYALEEQLQPISIAHGKVYSAENIDIIPLYHPAAAIYNRELIPVLEKDIQKLNEYQ